MMDFEPFSLQASLNGADIRSKIQTSHERVTQSCDHREYES